MLTGNFVDVLRCNFKRIYSDEWDERIRWVDTSYGKIRALDTGGNKPVIVNTPDGPNVIEHHHELIQRLSSTYRIVCFEWPGMGFSYPTHAYNYGFEESAELVREVMDSLQIRRAALLFSCSNGFFGIKAAELFPDRISHLFLAQTPSLDSMKGWSKGAIPKMLTYPVVGQIANAVYAEKFAHVWYKYSLPKGADASNYRQIALKALHTGGCFCLSSLVQSFIQQENARLRSLEVPATMVWGSKDFTHRKTNKDSIAEHMPNCEVIEFERCGHFPELEDTPTFVQLLRERLPA